LFFLVSLLIFFILGWPIFFVQQRPGKNGKPFKIIKFRTMKAQPKKIEDVLTDGERLTRFGRFLRSTSLDELPELFNVLRGEMSLVGPRPLLMEYIPLYNERQRKRHDVRPGITGWAQINGRNAISWEEKFDLDVWYVENQSFWLDIKIMARSVVRVLRREGVSAPGRATVEYFRGMGNDA
jgi:lipopolysaccharide/colanic/teichoic acid biosynthesis glycosyltransferase